MNKTLIFCSLTFILGVAIGYVFIGQGSVEQSSEDWKNTLPNVFYVEKNLPDSFYVLRDKYDDEKLISDTGEIVFSYKLQDLNDDGVSELLICEEGGGVGMDGSVCDIGIYQRGDSGNYSRIYQAFAETLPTVSDEVVNNYKVLYQNIGFDSDSRCEYEGGVYDCNPQ